MTAPLPHSHKNEGVGAANIRSGNRRHFWEQFFILGFIWWLLNHGDLKSWFVGGPMAMLGALAGMRLSNPHRIRMQPLGLLRFIPFFLLVSLKGGVDVAWRSLHPRLPIYPVLIRYRLRLPEGTPKVFMVDVVSLLPGTLSADVDGATLTLHMLIGSDKALLGVTELERRVSRLFGLNWLALKDAPA